MKHIPIKLLGLSLILACLIQNGASYEVLMIIGGMYIENGVRYTHR